MKINALASLSLSVLLSIGIVGSLPANANQEKLGKIHAKINKQNNRIEVTDQDGKAIKLTKVEDFVGEKTYQGKTENGPVKVTLLEKPKTEDIPAPSPSMNKTHKWTQSYTKEDPGPTMQKITSEDLPEMNSNDMVPNVLVASTDDSVAIAWADDPFVEEYRITGKSVNKRTKSNSVSIGELNPDTIYTFDVISSQEGEAPEVARTINANTLATEGIAATTASTRQIQTNMLYKTFIATSKVDLDPAAQAGCHAWGEEGVQFGGDGRAFVLPTFGQFVPHDYRTRMDVSVSWENETRGGILHLEKQVRPTHKYKNGQLVETRTATNSQMLFESPAISEAYAEVRFNHSAGNPFCDVGAITYNVVNRMYRNGTVETVGWRQKAPYHEGYAMFYNEARQGEWKTLFRLGNQSYNCLVGVMCATETINRRAVTNFQ